MLNGGAAQESLQPSHPSPGPAWIEILRLHKFLSLFYTRLVYRTLGFCPIFNPQILILFPVRLCPVLNLFLCCANRPYPCFLLFVAWAPFSRRTYMHHLFPIFLHIFPHMCTQLYACGLEHYDGAKLHHSILTSHPPAWSYLPHPMCTLALTCAVQHRAACYLARVAVCLAPHVLLI